MNLKKLVGKTFQENELYELLLFDIEENFELYSSKFIHFYFDRVKNNKNEIKIMQIAYFKDSNEINKKSRAVIEKKEWFEIAQNHDHFNLLLCRLDRTGYVASIWKDHTHMQDWCLGWADEEPDLGPMTADQIRQAFMELNGVFIGQQELQKLKSKKAV